MITSWQQKTVPGIITYSDAVRNGKKMLIVGATMVKDIKMKEINVQSDNSFAKLEWFSGVTLKHLKNCVVPSLIDEIPNRIILYGRCTDVNNKNLTPEKAANEIGDIAILCRGCGFNDIFMSVMIYKRSKF